MGCLNLLSGFDSQLVRGLGQQVDISMLDCQISMLNYMATMHFLSGEDPTPIGNDHFVHVPYSSYKSSDEFTPVILS